MSIAVSRALPRPVRLGRSLVLSAGAVAGLGLVVGTAPAALASSSQPVSYYVAPNGTDTSGSCSANSPSNAFPAIQDAITCAVTSGDVIVLAANTGAAPYAGVGTISNSITITGAGARSTAVDISSAPLTVAAGADVTVSGVSLTYPASSDADTFKPNVINNGSLTLSGDMVSDNPYSSGILNQATGSTPADLTLVGTAVTNNDASFNALDVNGGGILDMSAAGATATGTITVENSTIAGNTALFNGGGIWLTTQLGTLATGTATLVNTTVADNNAGGGVGGIGAQFNRTFFTLSNTLLAGNTSTGSTTVASDCRGVLADGPGGGNLIGSTTSGAIAGQPCSGLANGVNGDQVGVAQPGVASAPADNGGPTDTVALLSASPAIGAANAPTCDSAAIGNVDQRGDSRNALTRDACDIGAYDTGGN